MKRGKGTLAQQHSPPLDAPSTPSACLFSPLPRVLVALPQETGLSEELMDRLGDLESVREFVSEEDGQMFTFDKVVREREVS